MKKNVIYLFVILLFASCSNSTDLDFPSSSYNPEEWLIPIEEIRDGGPGRGGIPAIDNPVFIGANANYISDDDLVIGIIKGNEIKAYPHIVMDWHEIVNDNDVGGSPVTINYCPLTGTAFGWDGVVNGQATTFGVSGLLYNSNLILFDRNTGSNWSQLKLECVNGALMGDLPQTISVVETKWGVWKNMFPSTKVLSLNTGFNRDYGQYPYGDYITNNDFLLFNVNPANDALPRKERVYAIIDNTITRAYRFEDFIGGKTIKETFNGKTHLIVGNSDIINAFTLSGPYLDLDFQYNYNDTEEFFSDNEGNKWNIFGEAIEGPRTGEKLTISKSVVSYWFAIAAFYPNPEIYSE